MLSVGRSWQVAAVLASVMGCRPTPRPPAPPASVACPAAATCLPARVVRNAGIVLAPVTQSSAISTLHAGGRVAFDDLRVAHVTSPLSGRLAEVLVALGQHVSRGTPLARLHAPDMGKLLADAASAHADQVAAEREFLRQKALFVEHAVAQKDFAASENRLAQARATARQADEKKALFGAIGEQDSDLYTLRAPIDGNVIARNVSRNGEVQGSIDIGGDAPVLFTIGSLDSVWVYGDLYAIDAAAVSLGNAVEITVAAYPNERFVGKVDWLSATVDSTEHTVRMRCELANPNHTLKPDFSASLQIAAHATEGLWVPQRSIFRIKEAAYAFVALPREHEDADFVFVRRQVDIGHSSADQRLQVRQGLNIGDELVVERGIYLTGEADASAD